ncbi:serine hydrolase FSH [Xylariaceae sp. FL0804]|nr:serine hydrolase FSH [Xylariaceae sp. FL0804]
MGSTFASTVSDEDAATLHLPRILCLHGGGTNARIFRAQCRAVSRALAPRFRLAYAEAPFDSAPGPDVLTVYAADGPFKRWLRWLPDHQAVDDAAAVRQLDAALRAAVEADDARGATGAWAGLLGFSQGAKMAASLLFRQQQRREAVAAAAASTGGTGTPGRGATRDGEGDYDEDGLPSDWRFAVLMAGRAPLVDLSTASRPAPPSSLLGRPSQIGLAGPPDLMEMMSERHVLRLPTVHVHGLADPGLALHRELLETYCDAATARVIEWDGAHRVPLKAVDVQPLVDAVLEVAAETGVL